MNKWIIYDTATGKALGYQAAPDPASEPTLLPGQDAKVCTDERPETHYVDVDLDTFVPKDEMLITATTPTIQADDADACTYTNIPPGTRVWVQGPEEAGPVLVDDGTLDVTALSPGMYWVTFENFKYLNYVHQLEAV